MGSYGEVDSCSQACLCVSAAFSSLLSLRPDHPVHGLRDEDIVLHSAVGKKVAYSLD